MHLQALSLLNKIEDVLPVQLLVLRDTVKLLCGEGIQLSGCRLPPSIVLNIEWFIYNSSINPYIKATPYCTSKS